MKKLSFILVMLLTLLSITNIFAQSHPDWKWAHPRPQAQYLRWIKMVDANNWYACGDYGMFMKTTNAGLNWTTKTAGYQSTLYPGVGILQNNLCGYFINVNTGFLGVQSVAGIARTTNGGLTFDTVKILVSGIGSTNDFHFINSNTGYLAGSSTLKIMKTTDGGLTWNQLPNLGSLTFYSVYASDTNNVIAASSSGNVYITTNAGLNWTTSNVGTTSTIYRMKFANAMTGYVSGSSGLVRYTTNGGLNWTGTNPPTTASLFSIVMDGSTAYFAGYVSSQAVYKTTDNGATWDSSSYAGATSITGFLSYSFDKFGSNMMCVGTYGEMIKSSNNGANWSTLMYRKSLANLNGDLYAQSSNGRVLAVGVNLGANDAILYSPDGGSTWGTPTFTINTFVTGISMINPTTGYVSGRYGLFFKTTDGGANWDTTRSLNPALTTYFLNGVDFVNENTGWIVGGLPGIGGVTKIFKTTNGGFNWTEQTSAYTGPVGVKVDMVDANTGYMTHGGGLQKTTNGGDNWSLTSQPAPYSTSHTPVRATDASTVFTGSSSSQVYCTTNGGTSWDSLNFPVKAGTIFAMDWYNSQIGAVGAVIGILGTTTNRGQSWQIYNIGVYSIFGVDMVHPDTIYATSGNQFGAMVMKFSRGLTGGFTYEKKIPNEFTLKQNYPNPFNPSTTIEFDLPKAGIVSIKIFDITGREIATEINNLNLMQGNYKLNYNAADLSTGVYFYSLFVDGNNMMTKKMILIK